MSNLPIGIVAGGPNTEIVSFIMAGVICLIPSIYVGVSSGRGIGTFKGSVISTGFKWPKSIFKFDIMG